MESTNEARLLGKLQSEAFQYFVQERNPENGLVIDRTEQGAPASIAGVGFALACYPVATERGFLERSSAVAHVLAALRFFANGKQGADGDAIGHRGFFYHFLDMQRGTRALSCEISTVDTTFLLAGALAAALYFDRDTGEERELRELAEQLYRGADWQWATDGGKTVRHGWHPETGFIRYRWEGYDEALLLYVLALGSPTHPLAPDSYAQWCTTYPWKTVYDIEYLYGGPLFLHQYSHVWLDLRAIQDDYMREHRLDYFENSRRATRIHQEYCKHNPQGFRGYGEYGWGITASHGPGPATRIVDGVERQFFAYYARGAPFGPDDGTLAPWAVAASLPFAPELVLPTLQYYDDLELSQNHTYGYKATFNPTFSVGGDSPFGWISPYHYAINQGPLILMLENYRTGLVWELMRRSPYIRRGLQRAGFTGGWLQARQSGAPPDSR